MLRTLWNSRSTMNAMQEKLDVISNNIANVGTNGYKKVDVSFKDLMYQTLNKRGYPVTNNTDRSQDPFTGTGVRTSDWIRNNQQGVFLSTNVGTDFAIDGEGYFKVKLADGTDAYTRAGEFKIDATGKLVDSYGNKVYLEGLNGQNVDALVLKEDNFSVSEAGEIVVEDNGTFRTVARIPLYSAVGSDAFLSISDNLFKAAANANVYEVQNPGIIQGVVEGSNVDIAEEMVDMIVTQRAFQLGSKGITTADEMWQMANNLRR